MLKLKTTLAEHGLQQAGLARALELSPATVAQLVNHGQWPKSLERADLERQITAFLVEHGAANDEICGVFEKVDHPCANTGDPTPEATQAKSDQEDNQESEPMLKRKQILMPAARKQFGLMRDPFDDLTCPEDMYISRDIRYVRESMYQVAKHDGFLAVVGESGAGKSTLRRELVARIEEERAPVVVIEPYVLAMEDNDTKGKTLKSAHIAEAIMAVVNPTETPRSSPEARFRQMHRALLASAEAGNRHLLLIEEAHSLPLPTLKHLKRLRELERGFNKLLNIVLIGQPELLVKLSERNPELREVVQRIQVVELEPVPLSELAEFITFRFARVGVDAASVIDDSGIQALGELLQHSSGHATRSLLFPLAIGNMVVAAMNLAADLGESIVTADVVKGV
ncbi:MAG: AAA family ATPase [Porticoccaceae bacterium]